MNSETLRSDYVLNGICEAIQEDRKDISFGFLKPIRSISKIKLMKLVLKPEGRKIPNLIGLELSQVADITAKKIEERVGKKLDNLFFVIYQDSFVPPDCDLIERVADLISSADVSLNFGGVFMITSDLSFSHRILNVDLAFRIKDGDDFERALVILQRIKNKEVSRNAFIYSQEHTFISLDSDVGQGAVIYPYTFILSSKIGDDVKIFQGNTILKCDISSGVEILPYCYLEGAKVEADVKIGPFSRMRPTVIIKKGARIGNFSEIKNSEIGENTKVQHFSYIGDALIGNNVNIGAGTVTCNFDGKNKNKTFIADNAFVGSGTMLIAPIKLGEYSYVGAGSSINKDVPPYSLAFERAEVRVIPDWVKRKKLFD